MRPRRPAGVVARPLNFTVRTQMPAVQPRREKVASVVASVMSAGSFALAIWLFRTRQPYMTLWQFGATFALFSTALAPQRLFQPVTAPLQRCAHLSRAAWLCTLLSALCFFIGTIAWFQHLL